MRDSTVMSCSSSKLLNNWPALALFQAWFKHEGTRGVGQLRVDKMYIRKRSLRFGLETHPQRAATTAIKARAVRSVYHFNFFKHRTALTRCQTENSLMIERTQCNQRAIEK
jgi:hypothetical protein